jgi:hypothetical protein
VASILCVHGIGQQLKGEEVVANEWRAALRDGMRLASVPEQNLPQDTDITVAFYGDMFRIKATKGDNEPYELPDISPGLEQQLIEYWLAEAEKHTKFTACQGSQPTKSGWQPAFVQDAAMKLLRLPFFARLTEQLFVGALKQVSVYFEDSEVRERVKRRMASHLTPDTRLVVAHSLGSIVAYEVLCRLRSEKAPALVTLGSPLGIPNLIFDRLDPPPLAGTAVWPGSVPQWTNIADRHDIVAAVKQLAPLFGGKVRDLIVENEVLAHDVMPYLTAPETGAVLFEMLND